MKEKQFSRILFCFFFATMLVLVGFSATFTFAKYVQEVGGNISQGIDDQNWNDVPFEVVNPILVYSETDLTNALNNGYSLVKIADGLDTPIMMTGNSLNLIRDFIIDLNGNSIECNNSVSMLNIPQERTLTIIDSKGGGGMYNPVGSVMKIDGGKLQVYGGRFESGPRPTEYYSSSTSAISHVGTVIPVTGFGTQTNVQMPIIIPRKINTAFDGNIYFDQAYTGGTRNIKADTFCYMYIEDSSEDLATIDTESATFAYSYELYKTASGYSLTKTTQDADAVQVVIFGYENTIASAGETNTKYAVVEMDSGNLQINVRASSSTSSGVTNAGSFFSYFGKKETACVYFTGGTMSVETTGQFATVNPSLIPDGGLAKKSEGACVICDDFANVDEDGILTISKATGTAYNGSIIEMRGGTLNVVDTNFSKNSTIGHTTEPTDEEAKYDAAIYIEDGDMTVSNSQMYVNNTANNINYGYGILAKGTSEASKARLTCRNVDYTLAGSNSYGIYATHGDLRIFDGSFTLSNSKSCYGVYAVPGSKQNPVEINMARTKLTIGGTSMYAGNTEVVDGETRTIPASVGVYLNSAGEDRGSGTVNLDSIDIKSVEVGVAVNSGTLTFTNGGSITAYNASAIVLRDGDVSFKTDATSQTLAEYTISSDINRKASEGTNCSISSSTTATNAGQHLYDRSLPWLVEEHREGKISDDIYVNTDAIYVNSGKLTAQGRLNVTHHGLFNDYNMYSSGTGDSYNYKNLVIKSFAIAVMGGDINLAYANITNSIGGGVKVSGGKVTLGKSGSGVNDIIINTTGDHHYNETLDAISYRITGYGNWQFRPSLGGGCAVTARDAGTLEVYNGKYTASYADAVWASDGGRIDIHNGEFKGYMNHSSSVTEYAKSGPASHYGLKVTGAATVNIYEGKFDGRNGGAFISGNVNNQTVGQGCANVYVYRGQFGTTSGTGLASQDGFNVFDKSRVYFGAAKEDEKAKYGVTTNALAQNAIVIKATYFPIAVNPVNQSTAQNKKIHDIQVYIYYGTYLSSGNYASGAVDTVTYAVFRIYNIGGRVSAKAVSNSYVRYSGVATTTLDKADIQWSTQEVYYPSTPAGTTSL